MLLAPLAALRSDRGADVKKESNHLAFRSGYTASDLRRLVAEKDDLLSQYYVGEDTYVSAALNREDQTTFFIGPKGVGKSAILQMVRLREASSGNSARLIDVSPDDLAFNALVNITSRTPLLTHPGQNTWLFTSLWDYVLSVEVIRREHASATGLATFLNLLFGGKHEREQRQLLHASVSDDGHVMTMTDKMLALIKEIELEGEYGGVSVKGRVELGNDANKRGTDLQLLALVNSVARQLPKELKHDYFILIDDLDLHWTGSDVQNAFLAQCSIRFGSCPIIAQ